ncbi:hypothetical protein RJ640_018736 [Escallonia rubra]|uniref:Uncharacterized protein n=1 Tax=Escallonia rubra TaxID=112253 RepID=A0AA88QMF2_9ASTE|nr:hypothetical protein RJ640_018736 [Escallonia rubra]
MFDIIRSEFSMTDTAINRDPDACTLRACNIKEIDTYCVDITGASVTADSSVSLHFVFLVVSIGTTKRKELHGMTCIHALSGTWADKLDEIVYYAYKMDFLCSNEDEYFSSFILLIETKLDDDVGNLEVQLYLVSKFVKSSVTSCGQFHLDAEQVTKAKCFQELFFNGVFGKLFVGSKSSGKRELLLQTKKPLWIPSNMYLLLPLESPNIPPFAPWKINWMEVNSCVSVVEFLKKNAWLSAEHSSSNDGSSQHHTTDIMESHSNSRNFIHLANKLVHVENIREMVVLAIHTGKIYSVVDAVFDRSAESPFDDDSFSSFADYFNKKYGLVIKHLRQPLLQLKQSHNAHNLLVKFNKVEYLPLKFNIYADGKITQQAHVHMPPELLVSIDVRIDVLKSVYLLPSLMNRLESLMLASQLREEITRHSGNLNISSSLILEALTTLRCNESFSMERLELLGDSVLKYAVSCHLFLKYPEKNEGQLSARRSWAVCNATLHKLGTDQKLQGYIRDSPFDPRGWTAPGQQSIRPHPCEHGVDTSEVPLGSRFQTDNEKLKVGMLCDRGHRWMNSKTISDCVEALIGAYYVGGGLIAALQLMKWFGIDSELDPSLVNEVIRSASLRSYTPKAEEIEALESKLGYIFSVKGLLLEAMTHASEAGVSYCYQRLEFLGDSVLDILITWHLYRSHTDIDPGLLTDLRSASVNNESFAHAAVRRNLYPHLQHCSGFLLGQITEYVEFVSGSSSNTKTAQDSKGPKALGDLVESIAGALLIDSHLNLDQVWKIFRPLLSPIVTPENLELPPLRELIELCDSLGYFLKENCITKGERVQAQLKLQLKNALLVAEGCGQNRKTAKGQAASHLLKELEIRGISKRRKQVPDNYCASSSLDLANDIVSQICHQESSQSTASKRQKIFQLHPESTRGPNDCASKVSDPKLDIAVIESIDMRKGGPRTSLFDLCKRLQWPMPTFKATEHKSRTPIEFDEDGPERRTGFNSFMSQITLTIPEFGDIQLTGDRRADKKSSFDSAALHMLYELERQGKLCIGKV